LKEGQLSQYFEGVAAKRLSLVEIDENISNQHEFNVTKEMLHFLGREGRKEYSGQFIYFSDDDERSIVEEANLTIYDARANHKTRTEYRLYFQTTLVSQYARSGDLLIIAKCKNEKLIIIIAEKDSTREKQLQWLFGLQDLGISGFEVSSDESIDKQINFAAKIILEQIGIEVIQEAPEFLGHMLKKFDGKFPTTKEFSTFARSTLKGISSLEDPDLTLQNWMEQEEKLFKTLEKHFLHNKIKALQSKKEIDPDEYMQLMMSFQQRRKSRAGNALENHLEQVFIEHSISYDRTKVTERKLKPDFIFPSIAYYHQAEKNDSTLTMLAAKTTCKDRWRQILNEAEKIKLKHLITFEPSISQNQTDEMKEEYVQLVVPQSIHSTYNNDQQGWLMSVKEFLKYAKAKVKKK
jgi:hypothetical protein